MQNPLKPVTIEKEERLIVSAEYHIINIQYRARRRSAQLGFKSNACYAVATAVTELATNLLRHAGGGEIIIRDIYSTAHSGIEILSLDQGPGIADLNLALSEGFSTNGGLGGGLPGVKRLMDDLWINSEPGRGTCIIARKWLRINSAEKKYAR